MRTVITGGCGFIGRALALRLIKTMNTTDELILIDTMQRHGEFKEKGLTAHPNVKIIKADLIDPDSLNAIQTPVDRLYHLGAIVGVHLVEMDPIQVMKNNTLSTMYILDWFAQKMNKGARFLFSSSSEVYSGAILANFDIPVPTPETVPIVLSDIHNPRFSYALSKIWGEAYCSYLGKKGLFAFSVRYHNIYGPGMGFQHVIPQVLTRILSREDPFRMISPQQTRSFCWIEDAVKATHLVMESENIKPGMVVHIGNEDGEIEIEKLYEMLFEASGWHPKEILREQAQKGSVSRRCPKTESLHRLTSYTPETSIKTGVEKTVLWYKENSQVIS
jgi:nucleoside-diphosphate-sugar epimerase|tara:strand:+ start:232 stop:1227 length:996 start_codon:yes stop_codon:yes gene_type:complete